MYSSHNRRYSFNSRPHKEVDSLFSNNGKSGVLSIHDLTRRSTVLPSIFTLYIYLSIHDLTRRSTAFRDGLTATHGLSIHDLTRRSTILSSRSEENCWSFNSRPHKEVDYYGGNTYGLCWSFNSRPHKEVDVLPENMRPWRSTFNSRPHKEVDTELSRK